MKIQVDSEYLHILGRRWFTAIDVDTYDPAPDSHPSCRAYGQGSTEAEAVADLLAFLND